MSLPCAALPGGQIGAEGRTGFNVSRVMASGRTIELPTGGRIMDAVVDTLRRNLHLTNMEKKPGRGLPSGYGDLRSCHRYRVRAVGNDLGSFG